MYFISSMLLLSDKDKLNYCVLKLKDFVIVHVDTFAFELKEYRNTNS